MGKLSERLKETAKENAKIEARNRSKRTAAASTGPEHPSAHDEPRSKVGSFAKAALASIKSGMATPRGTSTDATLRAEKEKRAEVWNRRGLVLWSGTWVLLSGWAVILALLAGWTLSLLRELPVLRGEVQSLTEAREAFEKERETLEHLVSVGIVLMPSKNGNAVFQVDAKAKLRPAPSGKAQWLLVPETKKDAAR